MMRLRTEGLIPIGVIARCDVQEDSALSRIVERRACGGGRRGWALPCGAKTRRDVGDGDRCVRSGEVMCVVRGTEEVVSFRSLGPAE
ncbi:hypothetical protein Tco_0139501 [Tanacetum coccineum]